MNSGAAPSQQEAERRAKALMSQGYSWSQAVEEATKAPLPATPTTRPTDTAAPRSAMRTPESSAARRNAGLRLNWNAPFRTPELGPSASVAKPTTYEDDWEEDDEEDDVTMVSMTGRSIASGGKMPARPNPKIPLRDDDQRIANAPNLPRHPVFYGSTLYERRQHAERYRNYVRELSNYESTTTKPFQMPMSGTVAETARQIIAFYYFKKPADKITEQEWIEFFEEAYSLDVADYNAVDAAMKKLKMDVTERDAFSRVHKLVHEMHAVLREHYVEKLMADEEKPRLVKYLVEALEPADFRDKIRDRLTQDRNKKYRKDVVLFVDWLVGQLRSWIEWEPVHKGDSKPSTKPGQPGRRGAPAPTTPASGTKGAKPAGGDAGGAGSSRGASSGGQGGGKARYPCLKCQSLDHSVRQHPQIDPEEAKRLIAEWKAQRSASKVARVRTQDTGAASAENRDEDDGLADELQDRGTTRATVDDLVELDALLDTGADVSMVSRGVVDRLAATGKFLAVAWEPVGQKLSPVGGVEIVVKRRINLAKVVLATSAGPLVLQSVQCWIHDEDDGEQLILGRPVMNSLGYTTDGLLKSALKGLGAVTETVGAKVKEENLAVGSDKGVSPMRMMQLRTEENGRDKAEDVIERMALPDPAPASMDTVHQVLAARHADAISAGLREDAAAFLKETLEMYAHVFRLCLGDDPPVRVKPLKVRLKSDARPTRCNARKMNPLYTDYVVKHLKQLLKAGCLRKNNRSRWGSPPRVVPKGTSGDLRMVVDVRGVNERTDAMPWPMPFIDVMLTYLVRAVCFFTLDADKMFWQLPLDEESQELFTIMTVLGMLSPTRVLMGQTDAPAFAQATMEEIFEEMLNNQLLVWIDDVLGHAESPMQLMVVLRKALAQCAAYGLKLNPRKCVFYAEQVKWCGRVLSAQGVTHCPERIAGLVGLPSPTTAADLQQFICAVNWMRSSIPRYSELVAPLMKLLEDAAKHAGSRKKNALKRIDLRRDWWKPEHDDAYAVIKTALGAIAPLAHPARDAIVCVFTDASQDHWGAAVTQLVQKDSGNVPITECEHAPLAFLSGSFSGAASRWPIVEKEAFSIVETCKRMEFLLRRENGFRLYTDHRNLVYIFDPYATDAAMPRYQADKLQRWSTVMMMFRYEIYHVAGESNVWGDLLSRWGARGEGHIARMRILAVVDMNVSPLQDEAFVWPTLDEIAEMQRQDLRSRDADASLPNVIWSEDDGVYKDQDDKVWIPDGAVDMQQRLCVIAHAGSAGHRGKAVTLQVITDKFTWSTVTADVECFVRGCLHCLSVKGEMVPRPYGPTLHATKPNEVIHFDFLSMPLGNQTSKYVLVIKDDMSNFVELVECQTADADVVFEALLDWFKRFGVVSQWVSDQGSHFKNMVIEDLRRALGSQHHFVAAYCPWANGSVEVVNRMLLKVIRSLLSELKLVPSDWPKLLPVVQAALNNMPSDKLGGVAPITAFTQLPATTPLSVMFNPKTKLLATVEWVTQQQQQHLKDAADALEAMHRRLSEEAERKRAAARDRRKDKRGIEEPKLEIGDYVLVGLVTTHANKLALRWRGPRRIVRVIHDLIFEVQNLVPPFEKTVHHASRLRKYAEGSREVTSALEDHVRHTEGGHLVEQFLDARMGPDTHQPEVQVKWIGLEIEEATWELAVELAKDVPVLMRRFCPQIRDQQTREAIGKLLNKDGRRQAGSDSAATHKKQGKRKTKRS